MKIKMEDGAWQEGRKKDGRECERREKGRRWHEESGVNVNCSFLDMARQLPFVV